MQSNSNSNRFENLKCNSNSNSNRWQCNSNSNSNRLPVIDPIPDCSISLHICDPLQFNLTYNLVGKFLTGSKQ